MRVGSVHRELRLGWMLRGCGLGVRGGKACEHPESPVPGLLVSGGCGSPHSCPAREIPLVVALC